MVAGLNLRVDVIEINYSDDDNIGGAVVTGTVRHSSLAAVLTPRRPSQASLEAGLETNAIYDFTTRASGITINERDEIEVVFPTDHPLYNLRFRVTGVQVGRSRTRYGPLHCTLSRIRSSRSRQ